MIIRNPKQEGSNLWDCIPQTGPCPMNCNQCFYNRPGAFYAGMEPLVPTPEEVGDGIVRMNCGHDSNIERDIVIKIAQQYKHFFFNTSIPRFDFPGPVVFTANPREEMIGPCPGDFDWSKRGRDNIMFVRLRVSASNLYLVRLQVMDWAVLDIPIVLTFMAYYDMTPPGCKEVHLGNGQEVVFTYENIVAYTWRKRHINSYWCATKEFQSLVLNRMKDASPRLVTICGTLDSNWCRDCHNCETYYWQTMKRLGE